MKRKVKDNNFTNLELHQIKVIDDLQEEIKTLKLEITELNKDINAYKLVINIKDNTIQRLQKLLNAEMKENRELRKQKNKAIDFIHENSYKKGDGTIMYDTDIQKLENIIKGDSDV